MRSMARDADRRAVETLTGRKEAVVSQWLARALHTYPEHTSRFLHQEKDRFRNPIGHAFREALAALLDELLGGMNAGRITQVLDGIVRIRAVQDFTPARAVGFVFLLKGTIRDALHSPPHPTSLAVGGEDKGEGGRRPDALTDLEDRIDEMALLAFDVFMRCREQLYEVRANEARRRLTILERMHERRRLADADGRSVPLP